MDSVGRVGGILRDWRLAACGCCGGLQWSAGPYPVDCGDCKGCGQLWVRPNGTVWLWPGRRAEGYTRAEGLTMYASGRDWLANTTLEGDPDDDDS